jgi:hypothetical protein
MTDNMYIAKILQKETGVKLKVGSLIGYGVTSKEELNSFKVP